jgi:proline iminopeptidase
VSAALNPSGIRVAGIRMIAVAEGKYNVWTKRIGSGPVEGPSAPWRTWLSARLSGSNGVLLTEAGLRCTYTTSLVLVTPMFPGLRTLPSYLSKVEEVRRGLGAGSLCALWPLVGAAYLRWSTR